MTDGDQFATAAEDYGETEEMTSRQYAEFPTLLRELGPIDGADILDLACGTGIYSRMLARRGARRVVGVDASAPMVEEARSQTDPEMPVEYHVGDATAMPQLGEFAVVCASFLLNYAKDYDQLAAMSRAIAGHLRPGGRLVGTIPNPYYDFYLGNITDGRYGCTYRPPEIRAAGQEPPRDGDVFTSVLYLSTPFTISSHFWSATTCGRALGAAGLGDVRFIPWAPSQVGLDKFGQEFWQPWLDNPLTSVLSARKAGAAAEPA